MATLNLRDFIDPVPVCGPPWHWPQVLAQFRQGQSDRLVILNQGGQPLGMIYLHQVLPHLLTSFSPTPIPSAGPQSYPPSLPPLGEDSGLVPLSLISSDLSEAEFWQHLQRLPLQDNRDDWGVVDREGRFLGLLASQRLLQHLAFHQVPPLDSFARPSRAVELPTVPLLWGFIEQLPLPLCLQTAQGQVIAQNTVWSQEVGELPSLALHLEESIARLPSYSSLTALTSSTPQNSSLWSRSPVTEAARTVAMETPVLSCPIQRSERIWQFLKTSLPHSSRSPLFLVLAQDVTQEQQLASELAAKNADLVQLNRLKDEFLACISHELKTPLTSVVGLSTLLKDQVLGELNERQVRYAELIHQSGRQLMDVVNEILDLTRLETGQMELQLEPVQIADLCDRAIHQAQERSAAKTEQPLLSLSLELEPGLDWVMADELRLRQILIHLLSNALKFTEPEGQAGLRVSQWEGWIAFTVWDTGIGIAEAQQHLIFEKFQQLEEPLTRRYSGAGLGLVITQRLARLHGGDVSFVSKVGQGSEFTLLLPPRPPLVESSDWPVEQLPLVPLAGTNPSSHRLVLVVEAAAKSIASLTQSLTRLGYHSIIARSGTDALAKARRFQPQVILLNPVLPQLSGWDVLTLLKAEAQTKSIPVIVTASKGEKEQAIAHQAEGFLKLPLQDEALQEALARFSVNPMQRQRRLTLLHLTSVVTDQTSDLLIPEHRVVEADDLTQAELLARVWQPNLLVLDGRGVSDPVAYLQELASYPALARLPIITRDRATTQAANQVPDLVVFPCLAEETGPQALLQAVQVAAGMNWQPNILILDGKIPEFSPLNPVGLPPSSLKATAQYLQAGGYRTSLVQSWAEGFQHLHHQVADLLLLDGTDPQLLPSHFLRMVQTLQQLPQRPPILLLTPPGTEGLDTVFPQTPELKGVLQAIVSQHLPRTPQFMGELLRLIRHILAR